MTEETLVKRDGEPVRQFSIMLQNRVGSLGSLVRLVRNAHIEIIGMSMQDSRDATVVRMVVTDPDTLMCAFLEKGISHTICDVLVVSLTETGRGLGRCLDTLMEAETNVDFAYGLMVHPERQSLLALHLDDYQFGAEVLLQAGFKLLFQEDLSR